MKNQHDNYGLATIAAEQERYKAREIELIEGWSAVERDLQKQLAAEREQRKVLSELLKTAIRCGRGLGSAWQEEARAAIQ
jgi:hypothetical protein